MATVSEKALAFVHHTTTGPMAVPSKASEATPCHGLLRHRHRLALLLLLDVVGMAAMLALDVRDLLYKTLWLGPDDSYSFTAVSTQKLLPNVSLADVTTPQPLDRSVTRDGDVLVRASGWSSFLAVCDDVRPIATGSFFLHAMGINCTVGPRDSGVILPKLVLSSSARVDSIVWAACHLLRNDRRPVLCRAWLAQRFAERYNMAETPLLFTLASRGSARASRVAFTETSLSTVLLDTPAEVELLRLLEVIGRSAPPLSRLTCVEGFAYTEPGYYTSHIFGCGSATRFEAALVGHHAADYASLHQNKAFLTVDAFQLIGLGFLIRQNSWSLFRVSETASTWSLEHRTFINFSASGMLYTFAITIDVALLLVNLSSTLELVRLAFWPLVQELSAGNSERRIGTDEAPFAFDDYKAVLASPLFRSKPFAFLLLVSQLLCWMLVIPNSIVWTWSEDVEGQLQAYLSTLRVWVVPLILVITAWDVAVYFSESTAYAITARAHVSSWEAGAIACFVTFLMQAKIFAVSGTKYALDTQRVFDGTSFQGFMAFGNGFAEGQDTLQNTPWAHLVILYGPLSTILAWTFAGIAFCVAARFAYHWWRRTPTTMSDRVAGGGDLRSAMAVAPQPRPQDPPSLPPMALTEYRRLPIETLLNLPIRARSLVRTTHFMETSIRTKRFLRPSCYVEHGIVMEHHKLRARRGFFSMIRYSTDAESHAMPSAGAAKTNAENEQTETIVAPFHPDETEQPHRKGEDPKRPPEVRRRVLTPLR